MWNTLSSPREHTSIIKNITYHSTPKEEAITKKGYKIGKHDKGSFNYKSAGVDIDAGNDLVEAIKPIVKGTERSGVASELGF